MKRLLLLLLLLLWGGTGTALLLLLCFGCWSLHVNCATGPGALGTGKFVAVATQHYRKAPTRLHTGRDGDRVRHGTSRGVATWGRWV